MPASLLTSRALVGPATLRIAASSVAPVTFGYERSVSISTRTRGRVSLAESTICSEGDR